MWANFSLVRLIHICFIWQPAITMSKLTIEILEQGVSFENI